MAIIIKSNPHRSEAIIHNIKENKPSAVSLDDIPPPSTIYYNINGDVEDGLGEIKSLAKKSTFPNDRDALFYLKNGPDGLYNPLSMYSVGSQHLTANKNGRLVWNYIKVTEEAFAIYLRFLKTKNLSVYRLAQQMVSSSSV